VKNRLAGALETGDLEALVEIDASRSSSTT